MKSISQVDVSVIFCVVSNKNSLGWVVVAKQFTCIVIISHVTQYIAERISIVKVLV